MRRRLATLTVSLALASASPAAATIFHLSTEGGETLDGQSFRGGDVSRYDDSTGTATLFFDEDAFTVIPPDSEEVDAFELLPSGNIILSTSNQATLGTLTFQRGDLVEWDGTTATRIFDETLFTPGSPDIDAVAVHPINGHLLFSLEEPDALPGVPNILDGDIIEWDGTTATKFLDELIFFGGVDVDIDAFDLTADGIYGFSLLDDASVLGLGNVLNGDLVRYDINTQTATIWLSELSLFSASLPADIDAVAIPEPGTSTLFALGLVGLALTGRRRPR